MDKVTVTILSTFHRFVPDGFAADGTTPKEKREDYTRGQVIEVDEQTAEGLCSKGLAELV